MSTATALTASKSERASQLRAEIAALTKDVSQLQPKFEAAQRNLGALQDRRRELAESGKPGGELHLKIADAEAQVEALRAPVTQKQGALESARASLETVTREIRFDEEKAVRLARLESLGKQGHAAVARINESIRRLLQEEFVAYDAVRDALLNEFIGGATSTAVGPEPNAARALLHEFQGVLMDGAFLRVERALRRDGWEPRGDVELTIANLRPPRP